MYKMKKYRVRPLEEIKQDIEMARAIWPDPPSVFLADGNTIAMRTEDLVQVLDWVKQAFPRVGRISVYGSARFIKGRKVEDLKRLKSHGLDVIYMGLESGDAEVLRRIRKGATPEDFVRASEKVKEAGITLSVYVLAGLGGKERSDAHAIETARVLNLMKPHYIRIRTLVLIPGAPLFEEAMRGEFEECSPLEIALETKLLLENLSVEAEFLSDHVSNYLPLYGHLPDDREAMIEAIDKVVSDPSSPYLRPRIIRSL